MKICLVASAIFVGAASSFSLVTLSPAAQVQRRTSQKAEPIGTITQVNSENHNASFLVPDQASASASSRRSFIRSSLLGGALLATVVTVTALSPPAYALPMVTATEFDIILRDSSRSIEQVEFSGSRSETIIVRLVDGTAFGIQGVVESSTDPRSPLKIAAACKAYQVPARFVDLENALAASPRKKKMYTNTRVLEAAAREDAKKLRLQQDEEMRQTELAQMRQ